MFIIQNLEILSNYIGYSSNINNEKIYIYGGFCLKTKQINSTLFIYDNKTKEIQTIDTNIKKYFHTSFIYNNEIYFHGGRTYTHFQETFFKINLGKNI
jgi:hypothetical protein